MSKHIFLSYSSKDSEFAEWLEQELESNDYIVWRDKTSIRSGDKWENMIVEALEDAWLVIVIQSSSSKEARWVINEIEFAQSRNLPIIPFLLEGDTWFRLMHIQYIDVRGRERTPLPDEFYATLLQYAPDFSLVDEFPDVSAEDTSKLLGIVPRLRQIGSNTKSPKALAARELLKQFSKESDDILAAAAAKALTSLKPISRTPIKAKSVDTPVVADVSPAPEMTASVTQVPAAKQTNWLPILAILGLILVGVIAFWALNNSGNDSKDETPTVISQNFTPTSSAPMLVVGATSVEVRNGPGNEYSEIGTARNENLPVTGKSENGDYLRVTFEGQDGWIQYTTNVTLQGDLSNVMEMDKPPTPEPTPTKTATPEPTPTPTPTSIPEEAMLYENDFEDGAAVDWRPQGGRWTVIKDDDGNFVYEATTDSYTSSYIGSSTWENYVLELRVKPIVGRPLIWIRSTVGLGSGFYINLDPSTTIPTKTRGGNFTDLGLFDYARANWREWNVIRIEANGDMIKISVNGEYLSDIYDDDFPKGVIGLSVDGTNGKAHFDDIKVWSLDTE